MKRKKVTIYLDAEGKLIVIEAFCSACVYWERKKPNICTNDSGERTGTTPSERGDCHNFTDKENKHQDDWCGKFKPEIKNNV